MIQSNNFIHALKEIQTPNKNSNGHPQTIECLLPYSMNGQS